MLRHQTYVAVERERERERERRDFKSQENWFLNNAIKHILEKVIQIKNKDPVYKGYTTCKYRLGFFA